MAPQEPRFELAHAAARPLPPVDVPVPAGRLCAIVIARRTANCD